MTNTVNSGQRPSTAYQGSTPAGQTPASGNTLHPQLTAGGRAELERVFSEIPEDLRSEARQLLDSGKVLFASEFNAERFVSFALHRDLLQLAVDMANIAGMENL